MTNDPKVHFAHQRTMEGKIPQCLPTCGSNPRHIQAIPRPFLLSSFPLTAPSSPAPLGTPVSACGTQRLASYYTRCTATARCLQLPTVCRKHIRHTGGVGRVMARHGTLSMHCIRRHDAAVVGCARWSRIAHAQRPHQLRHVLHIQSTRQHLGAQQHPVALVVIVCFVPSISSGALH